MIGGKKRKKKQLKDESTFKKARRMIDSKASEDDDDSTDEEEASSDVSAESDESDVSGSDADNLDSVSILLHRCDQTTVKRWTSYLHVICFVVIFENGIPHEFDGQFQYLDAGDFDSSELWETGSDDDDEGKHTYIVDVLVLNIYTAQEHMYWSPLYVLLGAVDVP